MGVRGLAPDMRNKITEKWGFGGLPLRHMRNKITETGTAIVKKKSKLLI